MDLPALDLPGGEELFAVPELSGREKAAIVVRLLLQSGAVPALSELPESQQTDLAIQLARMDPVDKTTVSAVAEEFASLVEQIGLSFPSGIENTLGLLEGVISANASSRLKQMGTDEFKGDPWEQLGNVENERLAPILEEEAIEVAAIILSKLKVSKAAELLSLIPGERARRITYAVSLTGAVAPETVRRIGVTLVDQLDMRPVRAFADGPVSRVGAILNYSPASVRNEVLDGLDKEDADFAEQVRKAIFTFANIKDRVSEKDVPRIQRDLDQDDLVTCIASAEGEDAETVEFLLGAISKRLAEDFREQAKEKPSISSQESEAAMMRVVNVVRQLESDGEIFLVAEDE